MDKAFSGVRILDMTHVQSGPSCTQMLAWIGADVIKVELPGRGDITRGQLRDVPGVDSLYFTMLNCNKRSLTLNLKSDKGKRILTELIKRADVLVENFGPGVLDREGFTWERIRELNPRIIYASIKGFGAGPFEDCKAYETIAQAMGGSMSTTGFEDGPPTSTGAQIGDSGTGIHMAAAILAALYQRTHTGRGQRVEVAMQDSVLNLCRVKLRDQQRLKHGPLTEYPNRSFGDEVPRSGNASGGGQPGAALRCAPGGANDYCYVIIQPPGMADARAHRRTSRTRRRPGLRHARGPHQAPRRSLRRDRAVDDESHQARSDADADGGRCAMRADPIDEGSDRRPGARAARDDRRASSIRSAAPSRRWVARWCCPRAPSR